MDRNFLFIEEVQAFSMAKIKLAVKLSGSKKTNKVEFNFIFILIEKKIF